jgi:hypothetical protein
VFRLQKKLLLNFNISFYSSKKCFLQNNNGIFNGDLKLRIAATVGDSKLIEKEKFILIPCWQVIWNLGVHHSS